MKPKKTIRPEHKKQHAKNTIRSIKRHWQLYLIVALPLVYLIVFNWIADRIPGLQFQRRYLAQPVCRT